MHSRQLSSYEPRPVRFLERFEQDGWTVKYYGITVDGEHPSDELVAAGKDVAADRLPQPAETDDRYGIAVVIVHEGADGNYVLVDWWYGENMLRNHVYYAPRDRPTDFEYATEEGSMACVWELRVFAFERQAWIDNVLSNPSNPAFEGYLAEQLNEDV